MANVLSRRARAWLRQHLADLALFAGLALLLAWSWHGPAPDPRPGGWQAAARTAVNRHLGAGAQDAVAGTANRPQRTATAAVRGRDPG